MSAPPATCRSCAAPITPGARFCSSCGAVQTGGGGISGEHRAAPRSPSGEWPEVPSSGDALLDELRVATRGMYEVSHCLGRGGMAAVYLARDARLKRRVAIKVMLPELRSIPTMPERFRAEAQTAAALSHPNIIVIHSVEQVGELLFFVMSYVDGLPLDEIMRETGPLSIPLAQSLLAQVASALEYAHSEGVIHRDIKPANIMVNAKGDAVVTDFGIAKVTSSTHLTQTGATIGTAAYMSPEQCMGRDITVSSDQYSLGIVAYAMLTGRLPFDGTPFEVQMKQVQDPAPDPRLLRSDIPDAIAVAVLRMMAKLPRDRYPTVEEAAQAFGADVGRSDPGARARLAELARAGSLRRSGVQPVTPPGVVPRVIAPLVLALTAERRSLEVGETIPLSVQASDARVIATSGATWNASDARILDVTPDGRVVGIGEGQGSVQVTYDGASATIELSVVRAAVRAITVTPDRLSIRAGEQATLDAVALDARGYPLRDRRISWNSSSAVIASVAWTGQVQAISEGHVSLTASAEDVEQRIDVVVTPAAVAMVRAEPPRVSVVVGDKMQLSAVAARADGTPLPGRKIRWTSSDRKVASVEDDGLASGRKAGTATITAECEGSRATVAIDVQPVTPPAPVTPPPSPPHRRTSEEPLGATAAVAPTVGDERPAPSAASEARQADASHQHASSHPGAPPLPVATPPIVPFEPPRSNKAPAVSPMALAGVTGVVVAIAAGGWWAMRSPPESPVATADSVATVRAESVGVVPAPARDAVTPPAPDSTAGAAPKEQTIDDPPSTVARLRVDRMPSALDSGGTVQLTAMATDGQGRRVADAPLVWRSLSPRVASVSTAGLVRALAPGRARLEVRSGDRTISAELQVVSVAPVAPTGPAAAATPPRAPDNSASAASPAKAPETRVSEPGAAKAGDTSPVPPTQAAQPSASAPRSPEPSPAVSPAGPSDAIVRQLADEFAAQVAARRSAAIDGLLAAASATNTRKDFLQFVSRAPGIGASVVRASGAGSNVRFTLQLTYKTVGGQAKERQVPFGASVASAGGTWRLVDVRLEEPCCR